MKKISILFILVSIMLVNIVYADYTNRIKELEDENTKIAAQINQGKQQIDQLTQAVQQLSIKFLQNQAIIEELTHLDKNDKKVEASKNNPQEEKK